MRNSFISAIHALSEQSEKIMMLVADNGAIVFDEYRKDFPERFVNCGIAEANMIGFAAGLAACGMRPFVYTISNFMTMRALEQIRNDICLQQMNVKIVSIGGGFAYGALGPTHHATEDLAIMRVLPGMTVICPASPLEVKAATRAVFELEGPAFLRLGTNGEPEIYSAESDFKIGRGTVLTEGDDVSIIVAGPLAYDVLQAQPLIKKAGISPRIINLSSLKPIDKQMIQKAAAETKAIITIENHSIIGGLGSSVAEVLAEECSDYFRFKRLGIGDAFCMEYGSHEDLKKYWRLDAASIAREVISFMDVSLRSASDAERKTRN